MPRVLKCVALLGLLVGARADAQGNRTWAEADLVETGRYSDPGGENLVSPQKIVACSDRIFTLDLGDGHVGAFDLELKPLWRFGRPGSGPGEFRIPSDIACDAAGNAWVADPGNSRITVIDRAGQLKTTVRMTTRLNRLAVQPDGSRFFVDANGDALALSFDAAGGDSAAIAAPEVLRPLNTLQREAFIATTPSGALAGAFRWSGSMVLVSAGAEAQMSPGVEQVPFPEVRARSAPGGGGRTIVRIDPKAVKGARGVAILADTIYVIFEGQGPNAGKTLDRYSAWDLSYLGSLLLPSATESVAVTPGALYVLQSDPVSAIIRYEVRPGAGKDQR